MKTLLLGQDMQNYFHKSWWKQILAAAFNFQVEKKYDCCVSGHYP
jgi:hypothetical protein